MLARPPITLNVAQRGDALGLLRSLPDACTPLVIFDPQHRAIMDKKKYGNEGARQRERAKLPAVLESYIDACCLEIARILKPSGYLMRWMDKYCLCQGHHLRISPELIEPVDLFAWDNLRLGQGDRGRNRGDYLLVLQKPPKKAKATWRDYGIPCRWVEKIDLKRYPRKLYPHTKPIGLITRLIGATTLPGDVVIDPAAGSYHGDGTPPTSSGAISSGVTSQSRLPGNGCLLSLPGAESRTAPPHCRRLLLFRHGPSSEIADLSQ